MADSNSTISDLEIISNVIGDLRQVATTFNARLSTSPPVEGGGLTHIVDFRQFETRAQQIATMRHLHTELQKVLTAVAQYGMAAETGLNKDLATMHDYLETKCRAVSVGAGATETPAWLNRTTSVKIVKDLEGACDAPAGPLALIDAAPARAGPLALIDAAPARGGPLALIGAAPRLQSIKLGELSIEAVVIPPEITDPGKILAMVVAAEVYFIPLWQHFAVRCGRTVFHGNVGHIYQSGGNRTQHPPTLVKECRLRGACPSLTPGAPRCTYYHDPEECAGSTDVRNFVADSWVYSPESARHGARYGARRMGSRSSLDDDLRSVSADDARRQLAQTAHDIICAVILDKYVLQNGNDAAGESWVLKTAHK
jgi:hypothetical protein